MAFRIELLRARAYELSPGLDLLRAGACQALTEIALLWAGVRKAAPGIDLPPVDVYQVASGIGLLHAGVCRLPPKINLLRQACAKWPLRGSFCVQAHMN